MTGEAIAGRYRLLEPLGRGAMSSVWLAHDDELDRQVAVKLLGPTADAARFEREARAAASLSHPHISALYDYGEADGKPYMVLEYLAGGSLEDRLEAGAPLPDDETRRIASEMAAGLAHAHERGLVHRDLKPSNILFDSEGRAKIADFGIASMGGAGTLTEAGTVLGTASYISPEQAAGSTAGPGSDVYSFGVILFRMLTGRLPFVAANAMEVVRMHRDDPPPAVSDFRPDAPPQLAGIVTASLAKDAQYRPADGGALLRELTGDGGTATLLLAPDATQVIRRSATPRRRSQALVPLLALAAVLLGGGIALAVLVTSNGSGDGSGPAVSLTLPTVSTAATSAPALPPTTAPTTTHAPATTTAAATTAQATTTAPVTTAPPATTAPATTTAPTTAPVTTAPPPTTTAATTTDTTPITTATTP